LPPNIEYEIVDSSEKSPKHFKMPISDNIKLKIIQMNWQNKFFVHLIESGGQPKTNEVNDLIIKPIDYLLNEKFSYSEWETKIKKSIEKFFQKFILKRFEYNDNSKYNTDELTVMAKKISKNIIFIYFDKECFYLMCHLKESKTFKNLLNKCLRNVCKSKKIEDNSNSSSSSQHHKNDVSKEKSNNSDYVESLIKELEEMNRDKENPLYYLNQLIINYNLNKKKRLHEIKISEERNSKRFKASTSTNDSDWDSS
jgi:hypothetical protein